MYDVFVFEFEWNQSKLFYMYMDHSIHECAYNGFLLCFSSFYPINAENDLKLTAKKVESE